MPRLRSDIGGDDLKRSRPKLIHRGLLSWLSFTLSALATAPRALATSPVRGLTLREALVYAETHAPKLDSLRREMTVAGSHAENAAMALYPQLVANSSLSAGHYAPEAEGPLKNQIGLALKATLFDNGRKSAEKKAAFLSRELAAARFAEARESLSLDLLTAFTEISLNQGLLALYQENVSLLAAQYRSIAAAYKQGLKPQNDYWRVKVDLQAAELRVNTLRRTLEELNLRMKALLGERAASPLTFVPVDLARDLSFANEEPKPLDPSSTPASQRAALEHQHELASLAASRRSHTLDVALGGNLGLQAAAEGRSLDAGRYNSHATAEVTLTLIYPLWDWGVARRSLAILGEKEAIADNHLRSQHNDQERDLATLQLGLTELRANVHLNEQIVANSQKSFAILRDNYRKGLSPYHELITTYKDLTALKEGLIRNRFELVTAQAKLLAYQGALYEKLAR